MFYRNAFAFVGLFAAISATNAHILATTPTPTTSLYGASPGLVTATTPAAAPRPHDLQLRGESLDNTCGQNDKSSLYCKFADERCTNTIIWTQQSYNAYMICLPSAKATIPQNYAWTTGVGSWDANQPCGPATHCWYVSNQSSCVQYLTASVPGVSPWC